MHLQDLAGLLLFAIGWVALNAVTAAVWFLMYRWLIVSHVTYEIKVKPAEEIKP